MVAGNVDASRCQIDFRADLTGLAEELDTKADREGGIRGGPRILI